MSGSKSWNLKAFFTVDDKVTGQLKVMNSSVAKVRASLGNMGRSASALGIPLGVVSGIMAGFGVGAVKHAMTNLAEMGGEINKASKAAGMSAEDWQKYSFVADQVDVSNEALKASFSRLNKNLGDVATGKNKSLPGLFKALEIDAGNAKTGFKSAADIMPLVAEGFKKYKNPIQQAAMGNALFGRSWKEIAPMLAEGSDGIKESMDTLAKIKTVLSGDDVKKAEAMNKQLKLMGVITKGFQIPIAKALLPVMTPLNDKMIEVMAAFRKEAGAGISSSVKDLAKNIKNFDADKFVKGVMGIYESVKKFVDFVGGKNLFIGLMVLMNAGTIANVLRIGESFFTLGKALGGCVPAILRFGVALMTTPLGWIALGIAAVAVAAYEIYTHWDGIKAWWSDVWNSVGATVSEIGKKITAVWDGLIAKWEGVKKALSWEGIKQTIQTFNPFMGATPVAAGGVSPAAGYGILAAASSRQNMAASVELNFNGAPPGFTVGKPETSNKGLNIVPNVGYSSQAKGGYF